MFRRYGSVSPRCDFRYGSRVFILVLERFRARKQSSSVPMRTVERNRFDLFFFFFEVPNFVSEQNRIV